MMKQSRRESLKGGGHQCFPYVKSGFLLSKCESGFVHYKEGEWCVF